MKFIVCSVRDRQVDSFAQPMFFVAMGQAIRSFSDAVNGNDKSSNLCLHPDDFDLYQLGIYDDEEGSFVNEIPPKQIAIGKNVKLPKE